MAEEIIRVEHLKKYFDVRSNSLLKKEKKIVKQLMILILQLIKVKF